MASNQLTPNDKIEDGKIDLQGFAFVNLQPNFYHQNQTVPQQQPPKLMVGSNSPNWSAPPVPNPMSSLQDHFQPMTQPMVSSSGMNSFDEKSSNSGELNFTTIVGNGHQQNKETFDAKILVKESPIKEEFIKQTTSVQNHEAPQKTQQPGNNTWRKKLRFGGRSQPPTDESDSNHNNTVNQNKQPNRQPGGFTDPYFRFSGEGQSFRAKLIGVLQVSQPKGEKMCQDALQELKFQMKSSGAHKPRVQLRLSLEGLKIRDEKTGDLKFHHHVQKISFIFRDTTDSRTFGYVFGTPNEGLLFFAIKTEKAAAQVVLALKDLFQTVFELKKKRLELDAESQPTTAIEERIEHSFATFPDTMDGGPRNLETRFVHGGQNPIQIDSSREINSMASLPLETSIVSEAKLPGGTLSEFAGLSLQNNSQQMIFQTPASPVQNEKSELFQNSSQDPFLDHQQGSSVAPPSEIFGDDPFAPKESFYPSLSLFREPSGTALDESKVIKTEASELFSTPMVQPQSTPVLPDTLNTNQMPESKPVDPFKNIDPIESEIPKPVVEELDIFNQFPSQPSNKTSEPIVQPIGLDNENTKQMPELKPVDPFKNVDSIESEKPKPVVEELDIFNQFSSQPSNQTSEPIVQPIGLDNENTNQMPELKPVDPFKNVDSIENEKPKPVVEELDIFNQFSSQPSNQTREPIVQPIGLDNTLSNQPAASTQKESLFNFDLF